MSELTSVMVNSTAHGLPSKDLVVLSVLCSAMSIRRCNVFHCPLSIKMEEVSKAETKICFHPGRSPPAKVCDLWLLIILSLSCVSLEYINHLYKSGETSEIMTGINLSLFFSFCFSTFISFFSVLCQSFTHSFFPHGQEDYSRSVKEG